MIILPPDLDFEQAKAALEFTLEERINKLFWRIHEHEKVVSNWRKIDLTNYETARFLVVLFNDDPQKIGTFEYELIQLNSCDPYTVVSELFEIISLDTKYHFENAQAALDFVHEQMFNRCTWLRSKIDTFYSAISFWKCQDLRTFRSVKRLIYLYSLTEPVIEKYELSHQDGSLDWEFLQTIDNESKFIPVLNEEPATHPQKSVQITDREEKWTPELLKHYDRGIQQLLQVLDIENDEESRLYFINIDYEDSRTSTNQHGFIPSVTHHNNVQNENPQFGNHFKNINPPYQRYCNQQPSHSDIFQQQYFQHPVEDQQQPPEQFEPIFHYDVPFRDSQNSQFHRNVPQMHGFMSDQAQVDGNEDFSDMFENLQVDNYPVWSVAEVDLDSNYGISHPPMFDPQDSFYSGVPLNYGHHVIGHPATFQSFEHSTEQSTMVYPIKEQ